jgi:hypothetical protein
MPDQFDVRLDIRHQELGRQALRIPDVPWVHTPY